MLADGACDRKLFWFAVIAAQLAMLLIALFFVADACVISHLLFSSTYTGSHTVIITSWQRTPGTGPCAGRRRAIASATPGPMQNRFAVEPFDFVRHL